MKTLLASIALFSVALPSGAAVVETLGVTLPNLISAETSIGLFVAAFVVLLLSASYTGPRRIDIRTRAGARWMQSSSRAPRSRQAWQPGRSIRRRAIVAAR